ncbi:chromaffin granule amine transporter isoform X2 [Xenopus tropicalis]|uniref:Chromaffin granule amine transporter isoform X2 n=1 Tax=Xenopus tropicalis TaxID=8364 RepID=A0A8J0SHW4_XENTR|nr:chromaffin granule amine transporter isoform X2 [Xenopus tropicalis]|eukprot:XP_012814878.1 PREDICTED: chromaffin granule amine transporter-like isoform X2 [Xenopus tropicalis]
MAQFSFRQWLQKTRESRILILIVVTVALFVDCIINTVIAPILPTLLIGKNTSNSSVVSNYTSTLLPDNSSKGIYQLQNANGTQDGECYTKGKENSDGQEFWIGLLLAFKGMLQMVANPIVGVLTNRFGYDAPLLVGFAVVFFSTLMYAFGEQYVFLCVARGLQGIGSSLTIIPGLALLANTFPDDEERAKAMAISTSGLTVGILLGAPFGSLMNGSFGKSSPFYVLAAVTLLDGALRLCILRPSKFSPGSIPATPYLTLLADPYILVTVGLAFVPAMLTTILTLNGFAILSLKWGRWLCLMLGFIIQGIGIICFPLAANIFGLIGPSIVLGIGTALVGASIMPLMAYLIDLRHTSVYGGIYAITDAAFCLGFAIGPLFGGAIASAIGFTWVMVILCVLLIIYAPLFILLRNVSGKDEKKPILNQENTPEEAKSDDQ